MLIPANSAAQALWAQSQSLVPQQVQKDALGGADAPAAAPEAPADGDLLAAPPAKRDDTGKRVKKEGGKVKTTTEKSHGWYEPRMNSAGGDRRKSSGPRKKNMNRAASPETGTKRKNFPGASELGQLVKGTGIYELKKTSYSEEQEKEIFEQQEELKKLFEELNLDSRKKQQ